MPLINGLFQKETSSMHLRNTAAWKFSDMSMKPELRLPSSVISLQKWTYEI